MEEDLTTARFPCPQCGADFDSEEELASHRRQAHLIQTGGSTLKCPSCDEEFETQAQLETHGRIQHPP